MYVFAFFFRLNKFPLYLVQYYKGCLILSLIIIQDFAIILHFLVDINILSFYVLIHSYGGPLNRSYISLSRFTKNGSNIFQNT